MPYIIDLLTKNKFRVGMNCTSFNDIETSLKAKRAVNFAKFAD